MDKMFKTLLLFAIAITIASSVEDVNHDLEHGVNDEIEDPKALRSRIISHYRILPDHVRHLASIYIPDDEIQPLQSSYHIHHPSQSSNVNEIHIPESMDLRDEDTLFNSFQLTVTAREVEDLITGLTNKIADNLNNTIGKDTNYLTILTAIDKLITSLYCSYEFESSFDEKYDQKYIEQMQNAIEEVNTNPQKAAKRIVEIFSKVMEKIARVINLINSEDMQELCLDKTLTECSNIMLYNIASSDKELLHQMGLLMFFEDFKQKVQKYLNTWDRVAINNVSREYLLAAKTSLKSLVHDLFKARLVLGIDIPCCQVRRFL